MIQLKSDVEVEKMRLAGLVVAEALAAVRAAVAPGVTLRELDALADDEIRSRGAVPSFLDYLPGVGYVPRSPGRNSFPATICASVNDEIVHGIPDDRRLVSGDVVSVDCGAILDGWHGDAAVTLPVTAVSSVMGMNVIVNDSTHINWLVGLLLFMSAISATMLVWAHRQGWW